MLSFTLAIIFYLMFDINASIRVCEEYFVIFQKTEMNDGKITFMDHVSPNDINWQKFTPAPNSTIRKECTIELSCKEKYTTCPEVKTRINHKGIHEVEQSKHESPVQELEHTSLGLDEKEFIISNKTNMSTEKTDDIKRNPTTLSTILDTTSPEIKSTTSKIGKKNYYLYFGSGEKPMVSDIPTISSTTLNDVSERNLNIPLLVTKRTVDDAYTGSSGPKEKSAVTHSGSGEEPMGSDIPTISSTTIDDLTTSKINLNIPLLLTERGIAYTSSIVTEEGSDVTYTGSSEAPGGNVNPNTYTTDSHTDNATLKRNEPLNDTGASNAPKAGFAKEKKTYEKEAAIISAAVIGSIGLLTFAIKSLKNWMQSDSYVLPDP